MSESTLFTFTSDGTRMPAGQYLVTVSPFDEVTIAWRPEPQPQIVWGPPVYGERR